jgi:branched-chain amino acid transport system substrate-binding protein
MARRRNVDESTKEEDEMQVRANRSRGLTALGAMLLALSALAVVLSATATQSAAAPTAGTAADAQAIRCGTTTVVGFSAPITGPAAALGTQMVKWGRFIQARWNRANPRNRIRLVQGDTQLPDTAQAVRVAESFAANQQMLAVVGPAGSQEIEVSTAPLRRGGLGNISGTATRTDLTTSGTRRGFFFRTVPNDEQQAARAIAYMRASLRATRIVVVDAQNSYSVGLADAVVRLLGAVGIDAERESVNEATVTDFSSLIARIPNDTQVVYVPWQLAAKAQLFGQQLRASGRNATLFGADGLYSPDDFKIPGSIVTAFPVAANSPVVRAYQRGPGGGASDLFGLPSGVAVEIAARAIQKACANRDATRAEVRRFINRTNIPGPQSLLGFPIRFQQTRQGNLGPGDMRTPAAYIVYRISPSGQYQRVG